MTRYLQIALLAGAALLTLGSEITVAAESDQAQTIVDKADQIRFPRESFQVDVLITSTAPDRPTRSRGDCGSTPWLTGRCGRTRRCRVRACRVW